MPVIQAQKGKVSSVDDYGDAIRISVDCGYKGRLVTLFIYLSKDELVENINYILSGTVYFIKINGEYSLVTLGEK